MKTTLYGFNEDHFRGLENPLTGLSNLGTTLTSLGKT